MKNWSNTKKIVVVIIVIILIIAIWNWKSISNLLGISTSRSANSRSSNPIIQGFKNRASDISARLTNLIDSTNSKLKSAGSDGVIAPVVMAPKGLEDCECWSILWGAYGFYAKRCCKKSASRVVPNTQEEAILTDFRAKANAIENEVKQLSAETDAAFPSSPSAKEKMCPCWCVVYLWITVYCHKTKACCEGAA